VIAALAILLLGAFLSLVALQGQRTGSLPAGANFVRPLRVRRDENWGAFHLLLLLYGGSGLALEVWGVLAIVGLAPPPPIS
jgi:hypothetical protein